MISNSLANLNRKRRRALVEYLIKENFSRLGYKEIKMDIAPDKDRIFIEDEKSIVISFDLEYASNFREDAYKWCYIDFFIKKPGIDIPDELKRRFTRFIDSSTKKMFWRHREMARIIDMNQAVDYIIKIKNDLEKMLEEYNMKI